MGVPKIDGLFHGKSYLQMDDDWGYPHLWKPPCTQEKEKGELEHLGQSLASFGAVRILERRGSVCGLRSV